MLSLRRTTALRTNKIMNQLFNELFKHLIVFMSVLILDAVEAVLYLIVFGWIAGCF